MSIHHPSDANHAFLANRHNVHHHGVDELVAVVLVISLFLTSLLCLAICMMRCGKPGQRSVGTRRRRWLGLLQHRQRGGGNKSSNAISGIRDFASLNDWVCDMDCDDNDAVGNRIPLSTDENSPTSSQPASGGILGEAWEEVTVESVFPDLLGPKKKGQKKKKSGSASSLEEPLLPS